MGGEHEYILGLDIGGTNMVFVHRCNKAWWVLAEQQSAIWGSWGHHVAAEVTARQVLAVEVALRNSLAAVIVEIDAI